MKKILHLVATGKLSGAEKVVFDIANNLNKEKYSVIIACAGEQLRQYYSSYNLDTRIIDISKLNLLQINKLRKLIIDEGIDLIHAHDVKASIASQIAASKLKVNVISHIHGNYLWLCNNFIMKSIDCYFRKRYFLTIACSEEVVKFYTKYNRKFDLNKLTIMGNCFNFNDLNKIEIKKKEDIKLEYGINNDKFIFGYIGRLIELKGVDLLIKSFSKFLTKHKDAMLVIVGDGDSKSYLQELCKKLDIEHNIIFAGYKKNVYDYLNMFNTFIMPSKYEGIPIVILEAMAMKKIIISTNVGGIPEVIINNETGILLEERTEECLEKNMEFVYENYAKAEELGIQGNNFLVKNRNINNYIKELEKVYDNAIRAV